MGGLAVPAQYERRVDHRIFYYGWAWRVLCALSDSGAIRPYVPQPRRYRRVCGIAVSTLAIGRPARSTRGKYQPVTLAAMEGLFESQTGAAIVLIGQPDTDRQRLDNPIYVPGVLSFLTHRRWGAEVKGLNEFPRDRWPDNVPTPLLLLS